MIGKWIKKGEKLAKKGLKVCVGITERLFLVQKPVSNQGCHWTRKNEFYSVT